MKLTIFIRRSISTLLMLLLTLTSSVLAMIMFGVNSAVSEHDIYFPWLLFGDMLFPLLIFIPALFLRNRILTLTAILCSFVNIFLRLAAIIVYKETYMPLTYSSVKMLLEHSDMYALEAVLGKGFYFWLIPLLIIIFSAIIYCCITAWKNAGKSSRKISRWWLSFFTLLLGLSLISNLIFQLAKPDTVRHYSAVRPLPFVSMDIANNTIKIFREEPGFKTVPLPPESGKILTDLQVIAPPQEKATSGESKLDKIIIIAVESLDLAFIAANNPQMPPNITPELDRLSKNYPSMTNYFAASQPTSWGLNALLLSRLDYEKDRFIKQPSLFSAARRQGFFSWYFSAASGNFGNNRILYHNLFDADRQFFLEEWQKHYRFESESDWGLSDKKLFDGVYQELKKSGEKRFIAVISTMDTHPPYYAPPPEDTLPRKKTVPPEFQNKFLQALHNTDREVGIFVKKIMSDPELFDRRTLIIVTADHTATHGENYLKRKNFHPERIPLILISGDPELFRNLDCRKFASSIDLPPTLLKLIGSSVPENFMGRELFSGKNLAIIRTFGDVLHLHDNSGTCFIEYNKDPDGIPPQDQIFCDFYFSHYGK